VFEFDSAAGRRRATRFAGLLYLGVIAGGIFAEAIVRGSVTVPGDAAATAAAILDNEGLYRAGFAVTITFLAFNLPILLVFHRLLQPKRAARAMLMVFFFLVATTVETVNAINHMAALDLLKLAGPVATLDARMATELSYAALDRFATGFGVSLVYFGVYLLLLGSLLIQSRLIPRFIGALIVIGGLCYLINSFSLFLVPSFASMLFPFILLPCLIAELTLALWLVFRGIDERHWPAA
jgi:hypothetical protein